jgi:ComF family protein
MDFIKSIFDFVFPPVCLVCQNAISDDHSSKILCIKCDLINSFEQDYNKTANQDMFLNQLSIASNSCCDRCGEVISFSGNHSETCFICNLWPPPIRRVRSVFFYTDKVKALIRNLKYYNRHILSKYVSEILFKQLYRDDNFSPLFADMDWDLIVPLPSSSNALRSRGFSHTSLIAKSLGKKLDIPTDVYALCSVGTRKPQALLSISERHKNVSNAFYASPHRVSGSRVLLIDDIMTTGASIWAAANALLSAGVESVDALTLARSRDFKNYRLTPTNHFKTSFHKAANE